MCTMADRVLKPAGGFSLCICVLSGGDGYFVIFDFEGKIEKEKREREREGFAQTVAMASKKTKRLGNRSTCGILSRVFVRCTF